MSFEIIPYTSLGDIYFSMTREEIRNLLKEPYQEFYRNEFSKTPTDAFDSLGLYVNYTTDFKCEAIEASNPAEVFFLQKELIRMPFNEALNWIKSLDPDVEESDTGLTSYKFGFGIYAPDKEEEPDKESEGVIVFERGYYD